jgi:hypothetical protein
MMSGTADDITVTDHAVVRYLERVRGVDILRIRKAICPPDVKNMALAMGKGDYPVKNKFHSRVVNNKIVTVIPIKNK